MVAKLNQISFVQNKTLERRLIATGRIKEIKWVEKGRSQRRQGRHKPDLWSCQLLHAVSFLTAQTRGSSSSCYASVNRSLCMCVLNEINKNNGKGLQAL